MDWAKLKTVLAGQDYTGLSDSEAYALIRQPRHSVLVETRVSYLTLAAVLDPAVTRRLIQSVDAVAETDVLVAEVRRFLRSDVGVDVGHATVRAFLDQFAASALPLTPEDAEAIKALASRLVSDCEQQGLGDVRYGEIVIARELMNGQ